jgi:hypothetical protein
MRRRAWTAGRAKSIIGCGPPVPRRDRWKSANGSAGKTRSLLFIVVFSRNGDTGEDAYDTFSLATCVALTRVPPSSQKSSVSLRAKHPRSNQQGIPPVECLSARVLESLNNDQVRSRQLLD